MESWLIQSLCVFSHEDTEKHFLVLAENSHFQTQVGCSRKTRETCCDQKQFCALCRGCTSKERERPQKRDTIFCTPQTTKGNNFSLSRLFYTCKHTPRQLTVITGPTLGHTTASSVRTESIGHCYKHKSTQPPPAAEPSSSRWSGALNAEWNMLRMSQQEMLSACCPWKQATALPMESNQELPGPEILQLLIPQYKLCHQSITVCIKVKGD